VHGDLDIEGDLEAVFPLADWLLVDRRWGRREQLQLLRRVRELPANGRTRTGRGPAWLRGRRDSAERLAQAVHYHYDLEPESYGVFLDGRLVYTCAYFRGPDDDLDTAQEQKLDYICRKLRLQPGERLFDIGCGWGALVMHAAEHYGVEALGVTLSAPQAELANERIDAAGLADRCRIDVRDFQEVAGEFDKVSSIGMFEHLTEGALPEYFAHVYEVLRPGGAFSPNRSVASRAATCPPRCRARRRKDQAGRSGSGTTESAQVAAAASGLPVARSLERLHHPRLSRSQSPNIGSAAGEELRGTSHELGRQSRPLSVHLPTSHPASPGQDGRKPSRYGRARAL
jgi:predicted O-methyltransferase YrrM